MLLSGVLLLRADWLLADKVGGEVIESQQATCLLKSLLILLLLIVVIIALLAPILRVFGTSQSQIRLASKSHVILVSGNVELT